MGRGGRWLVVVPEPGEGIGVHVEGFGQLADGPQAWLPSILL